MDQNKIIKANLKLLRKYFPGRKATQIDTVTNTEYFTKRNAILMDAFRAWSNGDEWRRIASRNEQYVFGNQWGDRVKDPDGCGYITEEQLIRRQGNQPLKNNRLRVITRTILGVFSATQTEPVCVARAREDQGKGEMMSTTLQYVYQNNKLWELDRRNLEYMLLTGVPIFRSSFGWRKNKMDVWTDIVNYNNFFFDNGMQDPRHWDCHLVGQIWDLGLYDVISQFADDSREKAERIRELYKQCDRERTISYAETLTRDVQRHKNFFIPDDETRCRVIEVWRKESKERLRVHDTLTGELYKVETDEEEDLLAENEQRIREQEALGMIPEDMKLLEYEWFVDNYWYYYYLTPQGDVLKEGETPYWHESHPYSFKIYPFYNGRVYPFVSDFIDQQRYINRLIMLQDFIVRASAKGVLMFPEELLGEMSKEDVMEEWVKYNGVIFFKSKPGVAVPQQISGNVTQLGLQDMLAIQLKLLEDISGIQGALQGQAPNNGNTAASLYAQETQNSVTTLTDLFESYKSVREDRDWKNLKLIQQYYTEPRYINISGNDTRSTKTEYNPEVVRNAEFDLSISESASTPAFRLRMDEFLMQLFSIGQITLEELLENGSYPFADRLLQSIKTRQEKAMQQAAQMAAAQAAANSGTATGAETPAQPNQSAGEGAIPDDLKQQIEAGVQPEVLAMLNRTDTATTPDAN